MSAADTLEDERFKLELRQIIADIDLKRAQLQAIQPAIALTQAELLRKTQEHQLAPWQVFGILLSGGAAFFAAGAAFIKLLIG